MPTPPKPIYLVKGHRTKEEKAVRTKAESDLVTGIEMQSWSETKLNRVAHKHYTRLSGLFRKIGKNDALVENTLNRYCMLLAEEAASEAEDIRLHELADKLDDNQGEMKFKDYIDASIDINKSIQGNAKLLLSVRRLLLAIERENLMTLAAQMRSIPKKASEAKDPDEERMNELAARRQVKK